MCLPGKYNQPMIATRRYTETLLYTLAGGMLLLGAWLIQHKDLPAFLNGSFLVQQRGTITAVMLAIYAGLLLACGVAALTLARREQSLGRFLREQVLSTRDRLRETAAFVAACLSEPSDVVFLVLALVIGIGLRAYFMGQPMRLDESYTFLYYLNQGRDPFNYVIPNNHVLHTLLAWLSVSIGGMGPLALRLPAFLAGVLCIPLTFFVGRSFSRTAGVVAALGMAAFPYMILYSTMARGYSLLVLLTLCLLLAGKMYLDRPAPGGVILMAAVSALGLLTMPTMVFLLAGFYLWLALALWLKARDALAILKGLLIPSAGWIALLTVILYTPTVISSNGAERIFSNRFVDSRSWKDFLNHLYPHVQQILSDFSRDIPRAAEYTLVLLVLLGLFIAWRRRDWGVLLLLPSIVVGAALVLFAKHVIPFVRTWIYLIPFALLYADLGLAVLVEQLRPAFRTLPAALVFLAALLLGGSLISTDTIAAYADTGSFPEAAVVAQYLKPLMTGDEYIVVRDPANYTTFYYLCADDAPPQNPHIDPLAAKRYFITQKGAQALSDLTSQPATQIFVYGDAVIYTATGGPVPPFPAYTFDCRDTRK